MNKREIILKKIIYPILMAFAFAIIGWLWEGIYEFLKMGFIANHGVLLGPWLPIYGAGGLIIYLLLNRYHNNPLVVFMGSFVFCTIIEYATGWWLETYKGRKWWSYVEMPFNIDGRICLLASIFFGIGGLFVIYVAAPKLKKFFDRFNIKKLAVITLLLVAILVLDFIHSTDHPNIPKKHQIIDVKNMPEFKLFKK